MKLELNLMRYVDDLKLRKEKGKTFLFDPVRRRWLVLQPEELVRQLLILFFVEEKQISKNHIGIEKLIKVYDLSKRIDMLIYDKKMKPYLLVECKAPTVKIDQEVFNQIASYNIPLKVDYLLVSNGMDAYCCEMDYENKTFHFVEEIPSPF